MINISAPRFWYRKNSGTLLHPLSILYGWGVRWRQREARPARVSVPVICVGNMVVGGAGKTPVVMGLVDILKELGYAPHILSRGYGGNLRGPVCVNPAVHTVQQVGDEPLLLAEKAPTWISKDRVAGARAAIEAGADILLMDDGFQNPSLIKDASFVVIDGQMGFGNGRLIPAGPLREPVKEGLSRACAVILMTPVTEDGSRALQKESNIPVIEASIVSNPKIKRELAGRLLIAFAGIGRPEKFFEMGRREELSLVETHSFPDHYAYAQKDILWLMERAERAGATLLTTAKDAVRIAPEYRNKIAVWPVTVQWYEKEKIIGVLRTVLKI